MDSAVQRLSVALQRTIQRDQVLRSHLRRVQRGGVPADYFECGGDAGYRRSSSLRSSGDGGSSRERNSLFSVMVQPLQHLQSRSPRFV